MKTLRFFLLVSLLFAFSCDKDEEEPVEPPVDPMEAQMEAMMKAQMEAIMESMVHQLDLSLFFEELENANLKDVDAEALTVFAVKNEGMTKSSNFNDGELEHHIVKGSYDLSKLKAETAVKSLSGDSLKITKQGDSLVFLNGIAIIDSGTKVGNSFIFIISVKLPAEPQTIPQTTGKVTFFVKECNSNWSLTGDTLAGIPAVGATLKLYEVGDSTPKTFTSNEYGLITAICEIGTSYTYSISKGTYDDLLHPDGSINKGLIIEGIYTNTKDSLNRMGILKLADANGDGRLEDNDLVGSRSFMFDSLFIYQNKRIEVYIAPSDFVNVGRK